MLFFAGTRDTLCDLSLLQTVLDRITAPHTLEIIDGGDHSFRVPKSSEVVQAEVHRRITGKAAEWLTIAFNEN
jgi:hypothetical protein